MTESTAQPLERRLAAVSLVLSPAFLATGWLILPSTSGGALEELADVDASLGRWTAAWVLILAGGLLALPAALALARLVSGPPRTSLLVARLLAGLGAMGLVAFAAVRGLHGAQLAGDLGDPALDPGLASSWDGLQEGILRPFVYSPEIMAIGFIMLGLALARAAPVPRWAGWTIAAGAIVVLGALIVSQTFVAGLGALILLAGSLPVAALLGGGAPASRPSPA